jgi:hypothetical protein
MSLRSTRPRTTPLPPRQASSSYSHLVAREQYEKAHRFISEFAAGEPSQSGKVARRQIVGCPLRFGSIRVTFFPPLILVWPRILRPDVTGGS